MNVNGMKKHVAPNYKHKKTNQKLLASFTAFVIAFHPCTATSMSFYTYRD